MNIQTIVTVVAALAAGVLGAVVVGPGSAPPPAVDGADLIELRTEMQELARTNRRLQDRLDVLETRPAVVQMPAAPVELAAETVREVEVEPPPPVARRDEPPVVLKEQVSEALQAIRAEEERQRDEEREKRRQERSEEQLARLAQELGLNAYQTNQLRDAMAKQREKMEAARDSLRENRDWEGMRTAMEKVREEMNVALGTFMTQEQIDKYHESTRGFRGGRGDRGDRGGPGRGGRGF
ncbi:MAG: hypothetical protein ACF8XB_01190 [Planctomycetota bacterium JB042]